MNMASHALFRSPRFSFNSPMNSSVNNATKKKNVSETPSKEKTITNPSGSSGSPKNEKSNMNSGENINEPSSSKQRLNTALNLRERGIAKKAVNYDEFEETSSDDNLSIVPGTESEDSMDTKPMFEKVPLKLPYTYEEDKMILNYVLHNENIFRTSSILLWKKLECRMENSNRTYQSLKNRFLRTIKPRLFTTYKDLIPDKETEEKILMKFPELKNSSLWKKPTINFFKPSISSEPFINSNKIEPPNSDTEENFVSSTNSKSICQNADHNLFFNKTQSTRTLDIFCTEPHFRKVRLEGEKLQISFENNCNKSKKESQFMGIYEKYLKLKKNNVIVPCSKCGRGAPGTVESNSEGNDSTDDEGRLVIDMSYQSTPKKSDEKRNFHDEEKSPKSNPKKKRKSETPQSKKHNSNSPSLLSCSYRRSRSTTPDLSGKSSSSRSASKEKSNKSSRSLNEVINDKDLEKLYDETVANCQIFMDSDEEEKKENFIRELLRKNPNSKFLQPIVSLEKINVESFFFNPDWPVSSSENISSPGDVFVECSNQKIKINNQKMKEKPLAKNMMKMLKK